MIKANRSIMVVIFLVILLAGCELDDRYVYEGQSQNWHAQLDYIEGDPGQTYDLYYTYKGELEDLSDVEEMIFSYEMENQSGNSTINFEGSPPDEKQYWNTISFQGVDVEEMEQIDVAVEWKDQRESFQIKR
ncbi:hypothetical protein [Halobacillus litoralis]|uniref:Uncharacterized protein n=1 Tax=Halobacillus litoralis TaxID=45668 RepID=A0A410MIF2_9BACI|nr:hypothetical protein [Halobacillus litoralis]QAS54473.1 hypothetical protein HLI_20755 [Halobacillus litoralis]